MAAEQMQCPQCGEGAVNTPPTDPGPWAAHGMDQPQWSHTDGSSLCPALGSSGGYAPAQPQPAAHQPAPNVFRLDPPERLRPEGWARLQPGAWATQAVLDAIHSGQLRDGQAGDCGFWAAKATATSPAPGAVTGPADPASPGWAGHGFTRPGPGTEVPQEWYRAALDDALAYTTDHDGCTDCDADQLCETHAARAARAERYQRALDHELEAGS